MILICNSTYLRIALISSIVFSCCKALSSPTNIQKTFSYPLQVYIEDTDAYGIVYNGNYVKFFDRALNNHLRNIRKSNEGGSNNSPPMIISSVNKQKFRSSPILGDKCIINITPQIQANGEISCWDCALVSDSTNNADVVTLHSASLILNAPMDTVDTPELEVKKSPYFFEFMFHIHADEFDYCADSRNDSSPSAYFSLRSALNIFERARSSALGGPGELKRLQDEESLIFVVTSIDKCSLQLPVIGKCKPGDEIKSSIFLTLKRGYVIEIQQTLFSNGNRIAQAIVTLYCLNKHSLKPTPIPEYIVDDWEKFRKIEA